jgi:hypothetical protein
VRKARQSCTCGCLTGHGDIAQAIAELVSDVKPKLQPPVPPPTGRGTKRRGSEDCSPPSTRPGASGYDSSSHGSENGGKVTTGRTTSRRAAASATESRRQACTAPSPPYSSDVSTVAPTSPLDTIPEADTATPTEDVEDLDDLDFAGCDLWPVDVDVDVPAPIAPLDAHAHGFSVFADTDGQWLDTNIDPLYEEHGFELPLSPAVKVEPAGMSSPSRGGSRLTGGRGVVLFSVLCCVALLSVPGLFSMDSPFGGPSNMLSSPSDAGGVVR